MTPADLGSNVDSFLRAAEAFFDNLTAIQWGPFAVALFLWAGMLLARSHGWANALRAAYPRERVDERFITAAFLAGAGFNAVMPARAGDAIKVFLAKKSIPGASYPAVASSFVVLAPFDTTLGICVLLYALTLGLLPALPKVPELPAFDIAFWAEHPQLLMFFVTVLWIGAVVLFIVLSRRAEAFWQKLKQGVVILASPGRYLREVAAWQMVGWLCRFASFWFFLEAFNLDGSAQNVLIVMAVESVAKALPFTPGGAGGQQALLVATLKGPSAAAVLSFSVGQGLAVAAWALVLGFASLAAVFRITNWRRLLREGRAAAGAAE
ncbi:MAG TPA: lysylphosphatidylglycerol synthase transmembrane domain-containing protein [Solirubrobacterales bacterium]|nr:lysylphosphatidylglycerol synthase transmembrane domain-containing protein [Solirubrobacterales bacterium]